MYFWNSKALAEEFRDNAVSPRARMKYYLVYVALGAIAAELPSYLPAEPMSGARMVESLLIIIGGVIGTYLTYLVNRRGDDREFIDRSVCLGVPVVFRVGVGALLVYAIYANFGSVLGGATFKHFDEQYEAWIHVALIAGVLVAFYQLLAHHLARCSSPAAVA